jgi:DNA gyrase inhibitor GyrI
MLEPRSLSPVFDGQASNARDELASMTGLDVRIERLGPMRIAWVRAVGPSPEREAWSLLSAWAGPAGLLDDPVAHPVFGFNNPPPAPGAQEYGYELWVAVDSETHPPGGIGLKEFEGGLYAVTSCHLGADMPERWKALLRWVHTSQHTWRRTAHEIERIQNPRAPSQEALVDLCLPLEG